MTSFKYMVTYGKIYIYIIISNCSYKKFYAMVGKILNYYAPNVFYSLPKKCIITIWIKNTNYELYLSYICNAFGILLPI